ncbi:hypothetical protein P170DRAFT_478720 [Aspergillus steynii IBT 23096]|uniref:Uncharacterized protein n=1 Tax=Aspergillus steynii IBT 23096 TaxID=1392250 RepID=A0A2I2FYT7_9EURO|nr:uncharacterized protein P170DRAFT_478720 [Aspergillus steynii IBT 23096]PLB45785.1 hypothetical protein P170DRAFT_478720 [Aspergillus steynii IBT 23096]
MPSSILTFLSKKDTSRNSSPSSDSGSEITLIERSKSHDGTRECTASQMRKSVNEREDFNAADLCFGSCCRK